MIKRFKTSTRRVALITILYFSASAIAGASFWPSSGHWGETVVGRVLARVAPAFGLGGGTPPPPAPDVTATKAAVILNDVDADLKADPGDTIRYTVTISDATQDAANVHIADTPDPNTTLVGGSIVISPLAINETYASVGNMTLTSASIGGSCGANPLFSVTCNDVFNGGTLTGFGATQGTAAGTAVNGSNTVTTSNGGTVLLNTDGTFVYNPVAGFEGADSFWYTLTSPSGIAGTDNASVTINVGGANGMVWFITPAGAGTGRQLNPISLDGFRPLNNGTGSNPAAGDTIFLFEGAHPLTATLTLLGTQKVIGQDTTATLANLGAPAPQPGNAYPAVNNPTGTAVSVTSTAAALTLGSGNTLAGFTVGNATTAITGGAVGTLNVREVLINTNGQGLTITTSATFTSDATFTGFTSVSSSGGTNGVLLTSAAGTVNLGSGTLTGNGAVAFSVNGGAAAINYSGTIQNSGTRQVNIINKTGGTVALSGPIGGTGTGIFLNANTGATINFTGGIALSTSANNAFTATGGGTVSATQNNTSIVNTLATTTGTALNVANTTIGASGLTFRSINVTGNNTNPSSGIVLNTTGTGGLKVTGNGGSCTPGTPTCNGGTIQGTGSHGVSLTSVSNIEFNLVSIHNTGDHGIFGDGVNNFIYRDGLIFSFGNTLGAGVSEDAMHFESTNTANTAAGHGLTGTVVIQRNTIGPDGNFLLTPNPPLPENKGIVIRNHNDLDVNMTVTGTKFLQISNDGIDAEIRDETDATAGHGTATIDVDGSTPDGANDFNQINGRAVNFQNGFDNAAARIFELTIKNNTFTSVGIGGRWLASGRGTMNARYNNNTMTFTYNDAIRSESDAVDATLTPHATVNATVSGNTMGGGSIFISLHRQAVSSITFSNNTNIGGTAAGAGGCLTCLGVHTGINLRSDRGSSLGIDFFSNTGTADGSLAFAQSALDLQATTNAAGNSSICANIGGAGALKNTLTENPDLAGQQVISIDPVGGSTITIEGGPGGTPGTENFLIANNTLNGTTKVAISDPSKVPSGVGANCVVSPLVQNHLEASPRTFAQVRQPDRSAVRSLFDVSSVGSGVSAFASRLTSFAISRAVMVTNRAANVRTLAAFARGNTVAITRLRTSIAPLLTLGRDGLDGLSVSLHASPPPPPVDVDVTPTLPVGKTVRVVFDVTVNTPPVAQYSNVATITGSNFGLVTTNTVNTPGDRFNTGTALISSLNPADQGLPVTFTATVTPTEGAVTPDGTVQFKDNAVNIGSPVACNAAPSNTCTAQLVTSSLTAGTHPITADYLGGTNHDPSSSNTVSQVINACTTNPQVTTNADSGAGSLRQALLDACTGNTITFSAVVSPIGLTSGELTATRNNVTVSGPGANLLTVQRTSGTSRILRVTSGQTLTISGLTIAGGNATSGAGILNDHGTLTITSSTISGNGTTSTAGGGILNDGSTTAASLTIVNSTLSGNTASTGGAVSNQGSGGGTATATITNTTISGNTATGGGGGLLNNGTTPTDAVLSLTNSTITNNHADNDDAGAETGGGVSTITSTAVTLRNTIVAGNYTGSGTTTTDDISGTVDASSAFNLIGTGGAGGLTNGTNSNQVGVATPRLGPLANNGGPTFTHALLTGSPAVDAGDNTFVVIPPFLNTSPITDQRGLGFDRIRDAADANTTQTVDIGALEADPTVEDIADKSTNEDTALSFTFNIGDSSTAFGTITASSSNTTLLPNANAVVGADTASTRTLTLTPALDQIGTTTITVTVNKTIGGTPLTATDTFVLTVNAVNDAPTLTAIPDPPAILEDAGLQTVSLAGISAGGGETQNLTVTATSNNHAVIPDPSATYTTPNATGSVSYAPVANASGTAVVTVTVMDDGGVLNGGINTVSRTFTVTVNPVADTPSVTNATTNEDIQTTSGLVISRNVNDGPEVTHFKITGITNGTLFQTDGTTPINDNDFITFAQGSAGLKFTPASNFFGSGSVTVQASVSGADAGLGGGTATATITVNPIADTPSVTNATTIANVQSSSGLVITRNAADGGEVTSFKITNITNGLLFQNDGTTPIVNGAFIPVADGAPGLRFTPTPGQSAPGSFDVQASLDNAGAGLSAAATATITVTRHHTGTTIVSDNPDASDRFVPVTVVYSVVSTEDAGPTPTGTVTVTIGGGPETCTGTVAEGQCVITLTVAGVDRTITASYGGDGVSDISLDTTLHTVNNCPATPVVTTTADSGAGSLRQAIADACGTDTITFNIPGPGPDTIGLTTGELTLDKNLTITGPTGKGLTISGTNISRVFSVAAGTTVALSNLTIADGQEVFGAGIFSLGNLTLSDSTVTGNHAVGSEGGGIDAEGGTLTILNSTISGNTADTDGGGLLNCGDTTALLINVTITNNRADADDDGVGVGGGIAQVSSNTLTLRNTIVAGNSTTLSSPDDVNNAAAGSVIDPASHNNLIGVDTGVTGISNGTNGNLIGNSDVPLNPRLSPLQANGGPTFTHTLLPGSPALDAGDNAAAATAGLTTDQRGAGFARVRDAADADTTATVDIGAVEADPAVEDIPDQFSTEDALLSFGFHVGDAATPFDTITATSDTPGLVPNAPANLNVTGSGATRTLSIIPAPNAFGFAIITVTVTRGTQSTSDTFTLTVAPAADTPSVTNATTTEDTQTTSGLVITPNAADGAEVTSVRITGITGGTLFQADGTTPIAAGDFITFAEGGAGLRFTPAPDSSATGHVSVQASTDGTILGLGGAIVTANIVVTPIADTPSITNATTVVNAQTTSGLVISRNPADGAEVTHVQITNIVGGALFQQDGTTPIAAGSFITVAQGTAGLRFTPAPNSTATGHVTIQASTSNTAGGLGGGTTTADITVTLLPSMTTVVTSGSPSNPGQLVTFTATVTPALAGASGTVQFMDGVSPLGAPITLAGGTAAFSTSALAAGLHPITAVYSGNPLAQPSTGTLGQRVRASVTIGVTSSANPSPFGSPVTIQATPTPAGGETPTGTVTFREGASTLATVPLAAGTAAFTTATFALGTHTLTIDYTGDGLFTAGTATFDQIISCPVMTLGPATIAPAILGVPYTQTFTQTGGVGPIAFALTGALPGGLTFTPATATISGIPLTPGSYPITVTATPSNGCGGATANYTLVVTGGRTVLTGADAGSTPEVRRFSALDGSTPTGVTAFLAFDAAFTGGVRVAEGDVNGDGAPDFITGAGPGGPPEVRVYDGATGGLRSVITPFEAAFRGGVFVAAGDVNGDGLADVIVGSGEGRSAEIQVFSGRDGSVLKDFFAFAPTFLGGVRVAAGDVNGDGLADLIAGAGPGASDVKVFNGADLSVLRTLAPYPGFTGGVFVAAGDVTGDGLADLVTGAGPGGGPHVRVFDGRTGAETFGFFAYAPAFPGGVRVAVGDVTGDGHAEILTGAGPGGAPEVRGFDGATGAQVSAFLAYPAGFTGGVFVATAVPLHRMAIDLPAPDTTVVGAFDLAGWAFEEEGPGVGIAGIDVAAVPVGGGAAIALGAAALGDLRPDVAAAYGAQYGPSGFHLRITGLAPGVYDLRVSARGARSGTVNLVRTVRITVQAPPQPLLVIDLPIAGMLPSGTFLVGGWALTPGAAVPPGIDAIDVWAAPVTGTGGFRYLGPATLGGARPDVAAIFGAAYDHTGYGLLVTGLPTGAWDLYVFPRVTGATSFSAPGVVRIAVPPGTGPARAVLTGADAGGGPHVRRFGALDGAPPVAGALASFFAFSPSFTGGVRVAEGDVNGDGAPDYITGAGPGGLPEVRVYDGATGALRTAFLAFEPEFRGGVFVAAGDVDGDGFVDVIVGAGEGRAPEVKVFSGRNDGLLQQVLAFPGFTGGVRVAAGDVNGDGRADLIAGMGPGGNQVTVFNAADLSVLRILTPYPGFTGGVYVAAGDVNGDGFADLITGAGPGGGPHVRVFHGQTGAELLGFFAYAPTFSGGVRVAAGDVNGDGFADIITGAGPGGTPEVRVFDGGTAALLSSILAYTPTFAGGVFVATAVPVNRIAIDEPPTGASLSGPFPITGWAFEEDPASPGVDVIHVWAVPVGAGAPTFVGAATLGDVRPEVAAAFGPQYATAGYHLTAAGLAPGVYDLVVYARSARTKTFNLQRSVRVTITP